MSNTKKPGIFQDIQDPEERLKTIQDNAVKSEQRLVPYFFTEQEIHEMRARCLELDDHIDLKKEKQKEMVAEIKSEIKTLAYEKSDYRKKIRDGKIEKEMILYAMDDQEAGVMEYYDQEGNFIMSRTLQQNERQGRLIGLKTGTNDTQ